MEIMTAKEVAKMFRISTNAVYEMRNAGKLHQLDIPGVKFSRQEVESLLAVKSEYSATECRTLRARVNTLEKQNEALKGQIKRFASELLTLTADM